MKDRSINIKVTNITPKQWTNLIIELNLMADAWKPYGPKIKLNSINKLAHCLGVILVTFMFILLSFISYI